MILNGNELDESVNIIYPDVYIGIDIHDYINKTDSVMEYIKALE